ncbi:MAG: hypothetical protein P4N59_09875, partial [Negativicutes bacterium]|nr:hypothetical protein [Negativicutes bacterium]
RNDTKSYMTLRMKQSHCDLLENFRNQPENGTGWIIVRGKRNRQALGSGLNGYANKKCLNPDLWD